MLKGRRVLVVEDEAVTALDIADALEAAGAVIVGPVPSMRGGLELLTDRQESIDAASIDLGLADGDARPLIEALMEAGLPTVIYTGAEIPPDIASRFPDLILVRKPTRAEEVVTRIARAL